MPLLKLFLKGGLEKENIDKFAFVCIHVVFCQLVSVINVIRFGGG